MPTPQVTPDWIGHFIPTRTPTPFASPLPFPAAPGVCSVTVSAPVALPVGEYAIIAVILLALALVIGCSLYAARRRAIPGAANDAQE